MPQLTANHRSNEAHANRRWLAAYTRSRQENCVALQLQRKDLPVLLPTYEKYSRWSDRIRRVSMPLFPGYVFVGVADGERALVLQTSGVVNLVSSAGRPCPLPDDEVEILRRCLLCPSEVEPHPYARVGHKVRISSGPFAGWEGTLVGKKNSARVVVTVDQIMQSVAINVHLADIEAVA